LDLLKHWDSKIATQLSGCCWIAAFGRFVSSMLL
jgi:hypothetical protein